MTSPAIRIGRPARDPRQSPAQTSSGRRTNKAGIDLTLAAAQAIQLDGKGLVDWAFIENPHPTVT